MWTQQQLEDDLKDIGLSSGSAVLVHTSLEAIGPIEGGSETLVTAFREVLGSAGTLLVPTFSFDPRLSLRRNLLANSEQSPTEEGEQPWPFWQLDGASGSALHSGFGEAVLRQPDVRHTDHPAFSFAALGAEAEALTSHVPFHYPLGSDGPLAQLHQRNGWILLIGVEHTDNTSLHLAEIWASVPYVHRTALLKTPSGDDAMMLGSPECSAGFVKIEPLLRQSRILHRGYIGNAESQIMRQQQAVSMAVAMLQGNPSALLCEDPACRACTAARRMSSEQVIEPI